MITIAEKYKCNGCTACHNICPQNCITMQTDDEGFAYPLIDKTKCTNCGLCTKICPILSKKTYPQIQSLKAFAAINNDEKIRLQSTSGGVFSALAEYVLNQGGVVFGAGFDQNFVVRHMACENLQDLAGLRMSKYVQSDLGNTFNHVKKLLQEGRLVYFSGTPCQVAGLKSFLLRDYDNLITQDVICHGVPSPLVWAKYLAYKTNGIRPANVSFRDKTTGWRNSSFKIECNENTYQTKRLGDPFMKMFAFNKILRPSCHKCHFKGDGHVADITLADFWGKAMKQYAQQFDDNKGCSLVISRTQKGENLITNLAKQKISCICVPAAAALKGNPMYFKSTFAFLRPKNLGKHLSTLPFEKFIKKYGKLI